MPEIQPSSFLKAADHISAQYDLLKQLEIDINVAATNAFVTIDPAGSNNGITYTAKKAGSDGNLYSVTYVDPGLPSQSLSASMVNGSLIINLATNGGGSIITTANDIISSVSNIGPVDHLLTLTLSGSSGTGIVTAIPQTYLSTGLTGPVAQVMLDTSDADAISPTISAAQELDTGLS